MRENFSELSSLSLDCAVDLDNIRLGRERHSKSFPKFLDILNEQRVDLSQGNNFFSMVGNWDFYRVIWKATEFDPFKKPSTIEEVARHYNSFLENLEELYTAPNSPESVGRLTDKMIRLSKIFSANARSDGRSYLAA
jgi:hypothetical protein